MANIKTITQATGYIAVYAGRKTKDDRVEPVICWSVLQFDDDDDPDEVVGQIYNGQCITEANAVDEEEGYGEFVGYFKSTKEGLGMAREMCDAYREKFAKLNKEPAPDEGEEEEDEPPEEEEVSLEEEEEEGEEEEGEEGEDEGDEEEEDEEEVDDDDDDDDDDDEDWEGVEDEEDED